MRELRVRLFVEAAAIMTQTLQRSQVEQLVRQVLASRWGDVGKQFRPTSHNGGPNPLVVNVSARHAHVTQQDLETLFGPGAQLTKLRDLYQDGEFASEQTVNVIGPRNRMIPNVRILGPTRSYTQVELAYTDGIYLGLDLPLRISGNHEGTPGCVLVGPAGALNMPSGVIRAERHVHMHPDDCEHYRVQDGQYMKLRIIGPCGLTFDNVKVRQNPKVKLEVHIDTDEGNACDLGSARRMELVV
jgi:propanediol utilization protein